MADTDDKPVMTNPRIICFERKNGDRDFELAMTSLIRKMQKKSRDMFISEHNILHMNHGKHWIHAALEEKPDTTMHTISAEWIIPFKGIAENDLTLIEQTILPINEDMERQFAQNLYGTVGAAAEKVGNVVNAGEHVSFPHSMLEMFRKIEFGVDRDGNISMPQIHVGPAAYERIAREIQNVPPELEAEIEKVKAEKIQMAFDREAERKAKFKRADS